MDKILLFPSRTEDGPKAFVVETELDHLVKTASDYHPQIAEYIRNAKKIEGKTQILLTALGAGEFWGANRNGDWFGEQELAHEGSDYGYKTFESHAKLYKHHINKDPNLSYGDVVLAVYNNQFHRVELIVSVDHKTGYDIAKRIENGELLEFSMGCKIPYDVCSICGNKAKTTKEYCSHLKYYMNKIDPETGKKVFAINIRPRFFDISVVLIGADETAKLLQKVASLNRPPVSSAWLAEKMAEITKEIPITDEAPSSVDVMDTIIRAIPEVKAREVPMPTEMLNTLGGMPVKNVLSTLGALQIMPKPTEFQRIVLVSLGHKEFADDLDRRNICFDPDHCEAPEKDILQLDHNAFDRRVVEIVKSMIPERSYHKPFLAKRILIMASNPDMPEYETGVTKLAENNKPDRTPIPLPIIMGLLAGTYAMFAKKMPQYATSSFDKILAAHPILAMTMGAGIPMLLNGVSGSGPKGSGRADVSYVPEKSSINDYIEHQKDNPIVKTAGNFGTGFMEAAAGIPMLYHTSNRLNKRKMTDPMYEEGKITKAIRTSPDLLAPVLALEAVQTARGKPSVATGIKKLLDMAHGSAKTLKAFSKVAEMSDVAQSALLFPIMAGGVGLPVRLAGSALDQVIYHGSKKLLSKTKSNNNISTSH